MGDLCRFPTTPHLVWLGGTPVRGDKLLTPDAATEFVQRFVQVEEKVDGANLGISFDAQAELLAQSRGIFLQRETKGQFAPLWRWLNGREDRLFDFLSDRLVLFGEWCYARHSIHYTRLPDWFLAFDVFDKLTGHFFSTIRRDAICEALEIEVVPTVTSGVFTLDQVPLLIGPSVLYDGIMEGIYLRADHGDWLELRAKVVRAEFTQRIDEHWSKQLLVPNRLDPVATRK